MTEPITMEHLSHRLKRLERQNRIYKRVGAVALVLIAAVLLMAQAKPDKVAKVVEAEKFILRDASGNERAALEVFPDGATALILSDHQKGRWGINLSVESDGKPALKLYDQKGKVRMLLGVESDGDPILGLYDKNEERRINLSVVFDDTPILKLSDQTGKSRLALIVMSDGRASLILSDQNLKTRMGLRVAPDGTPSLDLYDQNGKTRATLGHTELIYPVTETTEVRPESSLVLLNSEGNVLWRAP